MTNPQPRRTQPPFNTKPAAAKPTKPVAAPEPESEPEPETTEQPEGAENTEQAVDAASELPDASGGEDIGELDDALFPNQNSLAEANDVWNQGAELANQDRPVGDFVATIVTAELTRSASSDRLQIHYELLLHTPDAEVTQHKYDGLGSPQQAQITRQQLGKLGVAVESVSMQTLPAVLLSLTNRKVKVKCKQNKEYYNIYFQSLMAQPVGGTAATQRAPSQLPGKATSNAPARPGTTNKRF